MKLVLTSGLIEAEFVARPNRFLSKVRINGEVHDSHVPDPGRLKELLFPGAKVLVEPKPGDHRKTKYATVMVYSGDELISINTQLPNRFARHCFDNALLPDFEGWTVKKQEYTLGKSRFDFLLEKDGLEKLVEVKSATLVEDGVARFPDAVTSRGRRHVLHLAESITPQRSAAVLFIIQRSDATSFEPHWGRDPAFAQALQSSVQDGVELIIYSTHLKPASMTLGKSIPYNLEQQHA